MKCITWNNFYLRKEKIPGPVSLTTGVFDGLHLGHQALIRRLNDKEKLRSVISTFSSNPFQFFFPDRYPGDLVTLPQKKDLLEALGVDYLLLIDFSVDFSKLSGKEFFQILKDRLDLKFVVLGRNHRFGHRGDTGPEDAGTILEPLGITVEIFEPVKSDGHPISSTRIRENILNGDVERASRLLGRPFSLHVEGIPLQGTGGSLLYRRENIPQILPKNGVYNTLARNKMTAESAVVTIDDRTLTLAMEKKLDVTSIDFLQKKRSEE